jgi:hypothetical protein
MTRISEAEFARICQGIGTDRKAILKHNPIGTEEETLLWMLLSCLISYLSVSDAETPCFTGRPDAKTYREAVLFVLRNRRLNDFDPAIYIDQLRSGMTVARP